ncbi:ATP-binding protein [Novosphingobium sp.]|uniref:ATP-binding protein n=1 Tax=Novosphingobium sp. TaxID=1874826 RepID=UPI001EB163C8|nr:ATP-binding protein [Novosphingobium sp.]MBK9012583.1 AAA family ATPase [Novosphingobium sp.]
MSSYDEVFHAGVNIIHGSNGSGKSTIADFIFFGLGGDLKDWKAFAPRAEQVYIQLITKSGTLSLRRDVGDRRRPAHVYLLSARWTRLSSPKESWQTLPYRRPDHGYSFSQVLFNAIGLPGVDQ